MSYNPTARRMAYLRWRVDNGKSLTEAQSTELAEYEAKHPRRGAEQKPAVPELTEKQRQVRELLAGATKTNIKNTKAADLRMLVEDAGYEVPEGATKGDLLEAAGLPREWAKS